MMQSSSGIFRSVLLVTLFSAAAGAYGAERLDPARIERLTGEKGKLNEQEGVFKVSLPRKDLSVEANGVKITPPMGLTAWAAFRKSGGMDMVMGDIVLTENQVNAVMSAALDNGLEVTALHNHFFGENPRIFFMHIGGMGAEDAMASAVGKVFARLKETMNEKAPLRTPIDPAKTSLSANKIDRILGKSGKLENGVYKATFGRKTSMQGHEVGNAMGVNTWAAFAGSDEQAVVDGDFAMLESELQPVLKALRAAGLQVVAIHNHMTGESPRIIFLHFWGIGPVEALAKGVKGGLNQLSGGGVTG